MEQSVPALPLIAWLIAIGLSSLHAWLARTEQELIEHLRRQTGDPGRGQDAAYVCVSAGDGRFLQGVRKPGTDAAGIAHREGGFSD